MVREARLARGTIGAACQSWPAGGVTRRTELSVGVIEFDPPIFGPSGAATLKQDMVISIDIPMFNTPWGGLRVEDGYVITADGAELLSRTPRRIRR